MKKAIGYLYDDYKVTLLQIILPKASAYVKRCDGQMDIFFDWRRGPIKKNIMLFGIKLALIYKKNLIASLSITKRFWRPK